MEGLSKSSVEFMLHPAWGCGEIAERIHEGPVVRTNVEGDKVVVTTVPHSACRGYVKPLAALRVGEVVRVRPAGGSLSRDEHLIYFGLLHERNRGVQVKKIKNPFEAIMYVQVALPVAKRVFLDLRGA